MAKKYYAVKKGRAPGIYDTWDECKAQTAGFSGPVFKSFKSLAEAEAFMEEKNEDFDGTLPDIYAFVDGSFNAKTGVYGYGGFLSVNGVRYEIIGNGSNPRLASMRNIAGEILGAQAGIEKAAELGLNEVTVIYDYMGIEEWAKGTWKVNLKKGETEADNPVCQYRDYVQKLKKEGMKIKFLKVKGHTGIEGNEIADQLAKQAVGVATTAAKEAEAEDFLNDILDNY